MAAKQFVRPEIIFVFIRVHSWLKTFRASRIGATKSVSIRRIKWWRLCVFAPSREMGFLIQAAVLAKAQRRKGRQGETPTTMAPFNSQKP
jgi:hypothetical protein